MKGPPYRIAVVIPKYGLVGGGERFAAEVTERLAENKDYEIHVFANRWRVCSPRITFHRIPIISFPRCLVTPSFAFFANRLIEGKDFDLVHTHDRIFSADLFTMHGIPHRIWVEEVRRKGMSLFDLATSWVEEKLVNSGNCKVFLTVSELAGERFLQMFPSMQRQVKIMSPGVALERFPLEPERRSTLRCAVRERYRIAPSDLVILFVGMNFELKGLTQIMESIALLARDSDCPSIKLLVVGKGNQQKFDRLARRLGIDKEVIFAGVVEETIEQLYLASDLFMMLSGFDTFGMVVLEAMAASLPVIVSDRVGAKDLVRDGENGFVVDRDDVAVVCRRLRLLFDQLNRQRMGCAARLEAEKHSWERVADSLGEVYQALLLKKAESDSIVRNGGD